MIKFLYTATRVVGLTYQLATTTILITSLVVGVVQVIRNRRQTTG